MPFKPSYGEPNWSRRPYSWGGDDRFFTPIDDKSYEENRLLREDQFRVPPLGEFSGSGNNISNTSRDEIFSSPSLLSARQATFLRWSQSALVDIIVGSEPTRYRMPSDFLTKRSNAFRMILKNESEEAMSRSISLPETAPQIFEYIFIWALSPCPELDPDLPVFVLVDIAIFATIYLMPALLHQVLDNLRQKMVVPHATFSPDLLEHIYSQVEEQSLLRYFTQAALATIGRSWPLDKATDQALESWKKVIERCPTLGYDYFHVQVKGWTSSDLAEGGPCRFHRHSPQQIPPMTQFNQTSCSRIREECFEDVNYAHNAEKEGKKRSEMTRASGAAADDQTTSSGPEHPVGTLEHNISGISLNAAEDQGMMDSSHFRDNS